MKRSTVEESLLLHARETPDKPAIIAPDGSVTYGELFRLASGYACFLGDAGLPEQGIVVIRAANTVEYAIAYFGVHLAGGTVCSLGKSAPADMVFQVAGEMGAKLVIADDIPEMSGLWRTLKRDVRRDAERCSGGSAARLPALGAVADVLFTTGTTGDSKGVALSHRALAATAENLIHGCGYAADMLLIVPGPLNHANAIRKLYTSIVCGNTVCLLNGLVNVKAFYDALELPYASVACCLPPAMVRLLLLVSGDKLGEYADRIAFIESSSAPLPETDRQRICGLLPRTRLIINYGSSEAASVCMYDCNAHPGLVNCIGRPMPDSEIFIVNDKKEPMPSSVSRPGLIACRSDVNMSGYVNAPALTAEVLIDGVVYTNDVGYMDEDGFVYIIGRRGDVINVGGLKVAPTEVEAAALEFPGIDDCICVAAEDKVSGSVPKLLYVSGADVDLRALNAHLKTRLEGYKLPKKYERTDVIMRTYNGKLDRKFYC